MKYYKKLNPTATNGDFKNVWDGLDDTTKEVRHGFASKSASVDFLDSCNIHVCFHLPLAIQEDLCGG